MRRKRFTLAAGVSAVLCVGTRISAITSIAAFGSGCLSNSTYRFRLIDASTRAPISDVRTNEHADGYFVCLLWHGGTWRDLPPTGGDGVVVISDIVSGKASGSRIAFTKDGYKMLVAHHRVGDSPSEWTLAHYVDRDKINEIARVIPTDVIVDLEMYPLATASSRAAGMLPGSRPAR
jgi:hypothetical protein